MRVVEVAASSNCCYRTDIAEAWQCVIVYGLAIRYLSKSRGLVERKKSGGNKRIVVYKYDYDYALRGLRRQLAFLQKVSWMLSTGEELGCSPATQCKTPP